ncbi:MAG: hypothetical protein ABI051_02945 [Vicinamibacterales bacterium]
MRSCREGDERQACGPNLALEVLAVVGSFLGFLSPHPSTYATAGSLLMYGGIFANAMAHWWINRGRGIDMEPGPWFYGSMCLLALLFGYLAGFCWGEPRKAAVNFVIAFGCALRAVQRRMRMTPKVG